MKRILLFISLCLSISSAKSQIIITGFMADPKGADAKAAGELLVSGGTEKHLGGFEYIQFMATEDIDFEETPFAVITCNNPGTSPVATYPINGWATGAVNSANPGDPPTWQNKTYQINLTSGTVAKGEFFYVGGPEKRLVGFNGNVKSTDISENAPIEANRAKWIRSFDYVGNGGDNGNGIGTTALMPNSGNPGGIAVFSIATTPVTNASKPIDVVFWGGTGGNMIDPDSGNGYRITDNDLYKTVDGGVSQPFFKQGTNVITAEKKFGHPTPADAGNFVKLNGVYNPTTKTWTTPRTLTFELISQTGSLADIESRSVAILPIDLISFTAKLQAATVNLDWSTVSETENSHFEITRSADGKVFEVIGTEKGNGTTKSLNKYKFTDFSPLLGVNYYQLRQVDFNGKSSLSKIEAVNFSLNTRKLLAYALDSQSGVNLSIYTEKAEDVKIVITNMKGEEVSKGSFKLIKGINAFNLPVQLSSGVYVARLFSGEGNLSAKFIKE